MTSQNPPRFALWLLHWILTTHNRDFIVDDLTEQFRSKLASGVGRGRARIWFWRQVVQSIVPSLRDQAFVLPLPKAVRAGLRDLASDLHFSIRSLRKSIGFTTVAVLTLALGIGANTAVFTVVNGVLLKPLAYPDQDRLVTVWSNKTEDPRRFLPSYPDYKDWRAETQSFESLAFIYGDDLTLRTDEGLDPLLAAFVTGEFFPTLRGRAILGAPFGAVGSESSGAGKQVVLKYGVWQGRFGGDPDIVGKAISFTDGSYTVAAVMDEGVDYPFWANVWVPLSQEVVDRSELDTRDRRVDSRVLARLRADVDQESARAELATIAGRLESQYPETNTDWTVGLLPLKTVVLDPWGQNQNLRRAMYVLMGAVGFVLLIACANLANLMLARVVSRSREMAVRSALGAGRWRLMRQTLTESLVLAIFGGVAGVLVAGWGVRILLSGAPALPRFDEIRVDAVVLVFSTSLAAVTALLFGVVPALRSCSNNLISTLKEGGWTSLGRVGTRRTQVSLVISQVGLALVLLIGAGLLAKSLRQLGRVDPGFNTSQLISVRIRPPFPRYDDSRVRADLYRRMVDAVRAVPGVQSTALVNHTPGGGLIFSDLLVEGLPEQSMTGFKTVTTGYFETMEIPVIEGRSFTDLDMTTSSNAVIINQSLARFLEIELGRQITVFKQVADSELGQPITGHVVGIVGDTRVSLSQVSPYPNVFVPYTVNPWSHATIVARTLPSVPGIGEQIRTAVLQVEPEIPGVAPAVMADQMYATVSRERFAARLMGTFAAAALLLSSVGIYGVLTYLVKQRIAEIGLRMAIGATPGQVRKLVVGRAMGMVLVGMIVGLGAAFGLTRFLGAMLFGVEATDLSTYALVTVALTLVAFCACYLPAYQAAKVDPLSTLRVD